MKKQKMAALFRRLLVASAVFGVATSAARAENPAGCTESALSATIAVVPLVAHIGDTLTWSMNVGNGDGSLDQCDQLNVTPSFYDPSDFGTATPTVNFGDLGTFQTGDNLALANQLYVVNAADLVTQLGKKVVKGEIVAEALVDGAAQTPTSASQTISAVIVQPNITITKTCKLVSDGQGGFVGEATVTITNTGDVALQQVVVTDDAGTPLNLSDDFSPGSPMNPFPANLAIGASAVRTYQYPLTINPYVNTVKVTATDGIANPGNEDAGKVEASDDCTLVFPSIIVDKTVACAPAGTAPCGAGLSYGDLATGVKGQSDPAFCYKIVVTNNGGETLNTVVLNDPILGVTENIGTLAAGASTTFYYKKSFGVATLNTATASGVGATSQVTVTDTDTAEVEIIPAAIKCDIILSNPFDMDGNDDTTGNDNHVTLDQSSTVVFDLSITNTGKAPLTNISINGAPCEVSIDPSYVLNPSETLKVPFCEFAVQCPGGANINVSISADVAFEEEDLCAYNSDGQLIGVSTSCSANVDCEVPKTCRTTGGGTLESQYASSPTGKYAPDRNALRPDLKNGSGPISHGGQLGAPYANETCFTANSRCIKGQWQHVRHLDGRGNPRENFHSNTFDSVKCACLTCEGESIDPTEGMCNPGDRVCGPEPRRAPANAIAFSGVGDFAVLNLPGGDKKNGRRAARSVVFRVYIQDRGEPGGYHPRKEGIDPADVYCFQMWELPDAAGGADSPQNLAFREAVAQAVCNIGGQPPEHTVTYEWDGEEITVSADINDCGPLDRGNRQLHPSTSAVCDDEGNPL